jgi:hypothetical protein
MHARRLRGPKASPASGEPLRRCETCDRYLRRNGVERPAVLIERAVYQ